MLNKINFTKNLTLPLVTFLCFPGCNNIITGSNGLSVVLNTVTDLSSASSKTSTTGTYTPPSGSVYTSFTVDLGTGYQAANICSTATIFGLPGAASCSVSGSTTLVSVSAELASQAFRDPVIRPAQITQSQENSAYGATSLPAGYRDIPSTVNDEGWAPNDSTYSQYGLRPQVSCGGTSFTTISTKITDCQSKNGSRATWTGATSGLQGQATWYLVFATGQTAAGTCIVQNGGQTPGITPTASDCYEVWQDSRTGLLWSSSLTRDKGSSGGGVNWCIASGNGSVGGQTQTDSYGDVGGAICSSTNFQNASGPPWSSCTESYNGTTLTAPKGFCNDGSGAANHKLAVAYAGLCPNANWTDNRLTQTPGNFEDYTTGNYHIAKGYMGALSNPGVRWRHPTKYDYQQADNDGIRFVMPDMGSVGGSNNRTSDGSLGNFVPTNEWSATVYSQFRANGWLMFGWNGDWTATGRVNPYIARCVGRSPSQ